MKRPRHKPKLYDLLSFPLGVEALEIGLAGVPQFDDLKVRFSSQPGLSATEFRSAIENDRPHLIVKAAFERWDKRPAIGSEFEHLLRGTWSIALYPARRKLKSPVRTLLMDDGIPALRQWLEKKRSQSWYWGKKDFNIYLDPAELKLHTEELVQRI